MSTPRPGSMGVVRTHGWAAFGIRLFTFSRYNHAVVCVSDNHLVEAQPSGAVLNNLHTYDGNVEWWETQPVSDGVAQAIANRAIDQLGKPYGWLDLIALGLNNLGFHNKRVLRRLARTDRLICSQLVDYANLLAGVQLYADGRSPGAVSPGDLAELMFEAESR